MKTNYMANYKGYITVPRTIQELLGSKLLTFAQLGAFIGFVMEADFDRRHQNYRAVIRDDGELAKAWGCSSSAVYRMRMALIRKGLMEHQNGMTKISNFLPFEKNCTKLIINKSSQQMQYILLKPQIEIEKALNISANMQNFQVQNDPQSSSVSSNEELSVFINEMEEVLTNQPEGGEYE